MTDDIFSEAPQQDSEDNAGEVDPIAQQLSQIKRADGSQMFDSVEKALESLAHAQKIIPELKDTLKAKEDEVVALSTQLEKAATVDDVLNRINKSNEDTNVNTGVDKVDEDKLGELVENKINTLRQAEQIQSNRKQVNDALVAKFGDAEKAKLALQTKAQELGVGTDFLASMADKSPKALLAYFNTASAATNTPSTNSVNLRGGAESRVPELEPFSLSRTSSSDQVDKMRQIRDHVFKKFDVTQ